MTERDGEAIDSNHSTTITGIAVSACRISCHECSESLPRFRSHSASRATNANPLLARHFRLSCSSLCCWCKVFISGATSIIDRAVIAVLGTVQILHLQSISGRFPLLICRNVIGRKRYFGRRSGKHLLGSLRRSSTNKLRWSKDLKMFVVTTAVVVRNHVVNSFCHARKSTQTKNLGYRRHCNTCLLILSIASMFRAREQVRLLFMLAA